jgi:hypothetical protein
MNPLTGVEGAETTETSGGGFGSRRFALRPVSGPEHLGFLSYAQNRA